MHSVPHICSRLKRVFIQKTLVLKLAYKMNSFVNANEKKKMLILLNYTRYLIEEIRITRDNRSDRSLF